MHTQALLVQIALINMMEIEKHKHSYLLPKNEQLTRNTVGDVGADTLLFCDLE